MLRFIALFGFALAWSVSARAVIVKKLSKDGSKVLLQLTRDEMDALVEGTRVVAEIGEDRLRVVGTLNKLNDKKKTIVLELDTPDQSITRKQRVLFTSFFATPMLSPLALDLAQYHQYHLSAVEMAQSVFAYDTQSTTKTQGSKTNSAFAGSGFRTAAAFYLMLHRSFGLSLSIDDRSAIENTRTLGAKASEEVLYRRYVPGFYAEVIPTWHLGFAYAVTRLSRSLGSGVDKLGMSYDFYQPVLSVTKSAVDWDAGVALTGREAVTAEDSKKDGTSNQKYFLRMVAPYELKLHARRFADPNWIYGGFLELFMAERSTGLDGKKPAPYAAYELARLQGKIEQRLEGGDRLDFLVGYAGARTPGGSGKERGLNALTASSQYYLRILPALLLGGVLDLSYGLYSAAQEDTDAASGQKQKTETSAQGYTWNVQVQARYDFDLTGDTKAAKLRL